MKNKIIISIIITAASFASCSYARKTQNSKKNTSEVVEETSNANVKAAVIDSLEVEGHNTLGKSRVDSVYARITTTREYFSGEFDFDSGVMNKTLPAPELIDRPSPCAGTLLYREKIVNEIGTVRKDDESRNIAISAARVEKAEQQANRIAQRQSRKTTATTSQLTIHRKGKSIAFLIILIIAVAGYVAYRYLGKKQ
ncbi:hypothetical protein [Chitinophaga sp. CF418]|uniref:hypothetical protein n=1 Tax=Chitinophaga sp. CF418 TaxID=1855287 RepID=UPI00091AA838|nr:hypothetical protein [Chitinophaga sp. CF418]SHN42190.1 hypothetical protein SAMN05216311_114122 [Chitinophaga sp. CF418]